MKENETSQNGVAVAEQKTVDALQKATKQGTMAGLKSRDISEVLNRMRTQIAQALPKHLTPERMIQMAATLIARNPKIAECSAQSLMGAVMQASILGFEPVDTLGHCYFVPYGGQIQFQIGYKGWISLARKSGEVKMLYAEVVRKGDEFEFEFGLEPKLKHVPNPEAESNDVTHVYAVAHYKDGGYNFIVLNKKQVEKLRLRSPMQKADPSGAWKTDYDAMAKAKAVKQLAKYMPLSIEVQKQILSDEAIINPKAFSNDRSGLKIEEYDYADAVDVTNAEIQEDESTNN